MAKIRTTLKFSKKQPRFRAKVKARPDNFTLIKLANLVTFRMPAHCLEKSIMILHLL